MRLAFGDQRFVLSPLSESGTTGFGLDLSLSDESLFLQLLGYGRDEAWRLGLRAATLGEASQAPLAFLLQPELPGHLLTVQLQP